MVPFLVMLSPAAQGGLIHYVLIIGKDHDGGVRALET
jgi:hypothetical protein